MGPRRGGGVPIGFETSGERLRPHGYLAPLAACATACTPLGRRPPPRANCPAAAGPRATCPRCAGRRPWFSKASTDRGRLRVGSATAATRSCDGQRAWSRGSGVRSRIPPPHPAGYFLGTGARGAGGRGGCIRRAGPRGRALPCSGRLARKTDRGGSKRSGPRAGGHHGPRPEAGRS